MTMLIEKYFLINESIMRQTAHLESTLKEKEKQRDDRIKELMKEIESIKQEGDNLESHVTQSIMDLESQVQTSNDIISQINLQLSEEKHKPKVKVPSDLNVEALSHRLNVLEQIVGFNTVSTQGVMSDHDESESISAMKTQIDHLVQTNETLREDLASAHEHMNEMMRKMYHLEKHGQTSETSMKSKLMNRLLPRSTTKCPQIESSLVDETNDTKTSNKSDRSDTTESGYRSRSVSYAESPVIERAPSLLATHSLNMSTNANPSSDIDINKPRTSSTHNALDYFKKQKQTSEINKRSGLTSDLYQITDQIDDFTSFKGVSNDGISNNCLKHIL